MQRALILIPILVLVLVGLFFLLRPAPPPSDPNNTGAATEEPEEKTLDLAVTGGSTMTPDEISVDEGDEATLRITSDEPLGFHLHGYDLEADVEQDEPAELTFDATITGRFDIENEETQEELGALLVQPS